MAGPWQRCVWYEGPCCGAPGKHCSPLGRRWAGWLQAGNSGQHKQVEFWPSRKTQEGCGRSGTPGKGQQPAPILLCFPRDGFSSIIPSQPKLRVLELKLFQSLSYRQEMRAGRREVACPAGEVGTEHRCRVGVTPHHVPVVELCENSFPTVARSLFKKGFTIPTRALRGGCRLRSA